jgi:hypothetical protein
LDKVKPELKRLKDANNKVEALKKKETTNKMVAQWKEDGERCSKAAMKK